MSRNFLREISGNSQLNILNYVLVDVMVVVDVDVAVVAAAVARMSSCPAT